MRFRYSIRKMINLLGKLIFQPFYCIGPLLNKISLLIIPWTCKFSILWGCFPCFCLFWSLLSICQSNCALSWLDSVLAFSLKLFLTFLYENSIFLSTWLINHLHMLQGVALHLLKYISCSNLIINAVCLSCLMYKIKVLVTPTSNIPG